MTVDDEELDVVLMAVVNDGSTGIGICRQGAKPVGAVPGGSWMCIPGPSPSPLSSSLSSRRLACPSPVRAWPRAR